MLEFVGLPESPRLVESELEDALLTNLQAFLLELGKGFAFIARQRRITLDGDHFYVDLVFYHVILKCYVLLDLGELQILAASEALRDSVVQQRRLVREMLSSVTGGRLRLVDAEEELPALLRPASDVVELTRATLRVLRRQVQAVSEKVGLSDERAHDLLTAVGEAAMNAVQHAGGGTGQVYADSARGLIQVRIQDHGKGIREEDLHRATLEKGWSGGGSLGHGFYLILRCVDRTYLLTSPQGTTVILEQERIPPQPDWLKGITGEAG